MGQLFEFNDALSLRKREQQAIKEMLNMQNECARLRAALRCIVEAPNDKARDRAVEMAAKLLEPKPRL